MMPLRDRIRVEPLDDERVARIEQRVMAAAFERAAPRRMWGRALAWLAPAVAVAGVLLAIYMNLRAAMMPVERAPTPLARIVTDERGASTYQLGDATVTTGARTTVDVRHVAGGGLALELVAGEIACDLPPRADRAPFTVHAGDIEITVVGTAFRVERGDKVRVTVSRGKVRIRSRDGERYLGAGESWTSDVLTADADVAGGGAGGSGRARRDRDDVAGRAHERGSEAGRAAQAGEDGELARASSRERGDERRRDSLEIERADDLALPDRTPRRPRSGPRRDASAARGDRAAASRLDQSRRALARARPERKAPPAGELAAIMELEARDPRAAVEKYRAYALGRGPEAEHALYSMAYVQHVRLGQRQAALTSLQHYQRRFPRGVHTESALWLRILILCQADDLEPCRSAAHTYLSRFPQGQHAPVASQIVNWQM